MEEKSPKLVSAMYETLTTYVAWRDNEQSHTQFADLDIQARVLTRRDMLYAELLQNPETFEFFMRRFCDKETYEIFAMLSQQERSLLVDALQYLKEEEGEVENVPLIDTEEFVMSAPLMRINLAHMIMDLERSDFGNGEFRIPVPLLLTHTFSERSKRWLQETSKFVTSLLETMASHYYNQNPHNTNATHPIAEISGSMTRRLIGESPMIENVWNTLSRVAQSMPETDNSMYKKVMEGFKYGPHDMDIKLNSEMWNISINELFQLLCSKFPHYEISGEQFIQYGFLKDEKAALHRYNLYSRMNVISVVKSSKDGPNFCCDFAPWPTEDQYPNDYRSGPHLSSKRQSSIPLCATKNGLRLLYNSQTWSDVSAHLSEPSFIENPEYGNNLALAVYAGLNYIRQELLHPTQVYPQIYQPCWDMHSMDRYREALLDTVQKFQYDPNELSEYRMVEIMREAILIMTINSQVGSIIMDRLGLADAFGNQDFIDCFSHQSPDEVRNSLEAYPQNAYVVAEQFDFSKIK